MGRNLDALTWMDDPTRKRAHEKLGKVFNKVAYPDSWRDYDKLQVDRASWLNSVLAANAFEVNRDLSKIGKPLDRGEWHMTPPTVNAYYNPSMNEMVFPAGILQAPFFDPKADPAVNYGAIGAIIGHEISHGFDDQGRKIDATGAVRDWWTKADADRFNAQAKRFGRHPTYAPCLPNACPTTCCRRRSLCLTLCRSRPMASSTGAPCRRPTSPARHLTARRVMPTKP